MGGGRAVTYGIGLPWRISTPRDIIDHLQGVRTSYCTQYLLISYTGTYYEYTHAKYHQYVTIIIGIMFELFEIQTGIRIYNGNVQLYYIIPHNFKLSIIQTITPNSFCILAIVMQYVPYIYLHPVILHVCTTFVLVCTLFNMSPCISMLK